jgi:polycystin 2
MTFGMTSSTMFYYTSVMTALFTQSQADNSNPNSNFLGIGQPVDWFTFAVGLQAGNISSPSGSPLLSGLYWESWYNGRNMTDDGIGYIFYENKLQGLPRIRQVRVRNDSCEIHPDFKDTIQGCYAGYSSAAESRDPFGKMNGTAWTYQTEKELDGSSYWGQVSTYGGGGYVQDLGTMQAESTELITDLYHNLWIDRGTRAIFIDFTIYNANINLFCVVKLLVEFPATGGAIPSYTMRTVKLLRYVSSMDFFVLACECIFCIFILYYIVEEVLELKRMKFAYLKEFWNVLDIIVVLMSVCCIAFDIYRTVEVNNILEHLLSNPYTYSNFDNLSYWQVVFNSALAIMVFFAWIKIFKYISFNKTMTQLSSTLGACAKDLAGFAVMFFIIFLAFAQLGYLIFGTQVTDFSSFETAIFTLFRIILGDFNFQALQQANRVLGPAYFILYVFFVFFILLNMFLAIINDTYSEVKADLSTQKNDFEMADYLKERYQSVLSKLNIKRDKIVGIQKAVRTADKDGDNKIDFEEWRHDLKMRGYAEAEIEAVFSKYDQDGNRALDEDEMRQMTADLEGQQIAIGKEYNEIDGRGGYGSDEELSKSGSGRAGVGFGASPEEFTLLQRRVDRMENSIGSIVSKIDAVLVKLEAMERAKAKRRETMSKLLDSITESEGTSDEAKRQQMERLLRDELEKWDSEPGVSSRASSRAATHASNKSASKGDE